MIMLGLSVLILTLFLFALPSSDLLTAGRPGPWEDEGAEESRAPNRQLTMPWTGWAWKLTLIAVIYVVIYMTFGALVAKPLAGERFHQEYYADLQLPVWILPL